MLSIVSIRFIVDALCCCDKNIHIARSRYRNDNWNTQGETCQVWIKLNRIFQIRSNSLIMIIKAASSIKTLTRILWKRIWNYSKGIKERINIENANYSN